MTEYRRVLMEVKKMWKKVVWIILSLLILGVVTPVLSVQEGYSQGWLGAPDWVLDRIDTSILPDFFYPRNISEVHDDLPTVTGSIASGNDMLAGGSYLDAKAQFEKAITINSRSYEAWLGRGYALEGLKRYQSALESYEKAILYSTNKESAWAAYAGKARSLLALNQYDAAEKAFESSIQKLEQTGMGYNEGLVDLYSALAGIQERKGSESISSQSLMTPEDTRSESEKVSVFSLNDEDPLLYI